LPGPDAVGAGNQSELARSCFVKTVSECYESAIQIEGGVFPVDWVFSFSKQCLLAVAVASSLVGCAAMERGPATHNERTRIVELTPHADLVYPRPVAQRAANLSPSGKTGVKITHVSLDTDQAELSVTEQATRRFADISRDYQHFYTESDLRFAAMGLALGATFAHTDVDEDFRNWWQDDVRSNAWGDFSNFAKPLGDGHISVAIMGAAMVGGAWADETRLGRVANTWGNRSLRAVAVGAPPLLLLQVATGSGRPGESSAESDWRPFQDGNGVSGHAFMGAVPFIVAAQMTDNPLLSGLWYTGSLMTGISRINDDDHYLSQVVLGWWLAKMACDAVDKTEGRKDKPSKIVPLLGAGGTVGMGIELRR